MTIGALNGVHVLDISQDIAGSFCARLLADYGAEVIKVEPPSGAALRRQGPFHSDDPHPEKSLLFFVLNVNKQGITLNLEASGGPELLKQLAADADVVVETYKPGYLDSLGIGYEALREVNQRLVLTSITPFGQTGPYSQYEGDELMCYAMSTIMSISGTSDREPLKHGGFQAQYEGGLNGAGATTMALFHQSMTGEGQHLDVSITECVASTMLATQSMYAYTGGVQARRPAVGIAVRQPHGLRRRVGHRPDGRWGHMGHPSRLLWKGRVARPPLLRGRPAHQQWRRDGRPDGGRHQGPRTLGAVPRGIEEPHALWPRADPGRLGSLPATGVARLLPRNRAPRDGPTCACLPCC